MASPVGMGPQSAVVVRQRQGMVCLSATLVAQFAEGRPEAHIRDRRPPGPRSAAWRNSRERQRPADCPRGCRSEDSPRLRRRETPSSPRKAAVRSKVRCSATARWRRLPARSPLAHRQLAKSQPARPSPSRAAIRPQQRLPRQFGPRDPCARAPAVMRQPVMRPAVMRPAVIDDEEGGAWLTTGIIGSLGDLKRRSEQPYGPSEGDP